MRHRSSVAVVESDQGDLHLVLSPARSIDTHVVRCAPRIRRDSFLASPAVSRADVRSFGFAPSRVSPTDRLALDPVVPARLARRVCGTTGALEHGRVPGLHVFPSEDSALAHLHARGLRKHTERGCAILGCATFGDVALVLLARKVRTAVVLPNGHEVLTVVDARWIRANLRDPAATLSREERASVQSLTEIPMENLYFYCETHDVTRAFAHAREDTLADPDQEWVWNDALSAPLRALGIPGACPPLLQGLAESRRLTDARGVEWRLAVFGRRSSMHPGTRYLARGLNARAAPGNEVEMEQLVWRKGGEDAMEADATAAGATEAGAGAESNAGGEDRPGSATAAVSAAAASGNGNGSSASGASAGSDGGTVRWSSYVWRRGSVPIRWRQEIKQSIGEAEIYVAGENPYQGTGKYFRRLSRCYRPGDAGSSEGFPVTCVNLLRCAPGKPELLLSEHFHEAVRGVRKSAGLSAITVLNFDWHGNIKALGEAKTVEGLWNALRSYLVEAGVSRGVCGAAADHTGAGNAREKVTAQWQRGVLRYNCADSLDRTNLASYFAAIQVLAEQCRVLGLDVASPDVDVGSGSGGETGSTAAGSNAATSATYGRRDGGAASPAPSPALPPGWESRYDPVTGRTFYIDHNTRTTQWSLPPRATEPEPAVPNGSDAGSRDGAGDAGSGSTLGSRGGTGDGDRGEGEGGGLSRGRSGVSSDSWRLLGLGVDEVRAAVLAPVLAAMCEIFLANGDLHAAVYTASRAIHTAIFHLLDGSTSARTKREQGSAYAAAASLSNLSISAQRRFLNMTQDAHRQQQFEMFLDVNRESHFPSSARARRAGDAANAAATTVPSSFSASPYANGGSASSPSSESASLAGTPQTSSSFLANVGSFASPLRRNSDGAAGGGSGILSPAASPSHGSSISRPDAADGRVADAEASSARGGSGSDVAVLTRPPSAAVLVAPPSLGAPLAPPDALVAAGTSSCASPLWACPPGTREATLAVWLGRPGAPERLLLTTPRGAPEHVAPARVDVLAGPSLDALTPLAVNLAVPRAPPGTPMLFALRPRRSDAWRFDDGAADVRAFAAEAAASAGGALAAEDRPGPGVPGVPGAPGVPGVPGAGSRDDSDPRRRSVSPQPPCRVVTLRFRAANGPGSESRAMALGHVEVLGAPADAATESSSPRRTRTDAGYGSGYGSGSGSGSGFGYETPLRGSGGSLPSARSPAGSLSRARTAAASLFRGLVDDADAETRRDDRDDAETRFASSSSRDDSDPSTDEPATVRVSEGAETDEATYVDAARSALGSSSRASLSRLLELERLRLEIGASATRRDAILAAAGIDPADLDPTPALRSRDVNAHLKALARERAAAAAAAAAAPRASTLGGLASLSPWEQLMGQGASVARAVGGVVSMGGGGGGGSVGIGANAANATSTSTSATASAAAGGSSSHLAGMVDAACDGRVDAGGGFGVASDGPDAKRAARDDEESRERAREDRLLADLHVLAARRKTPSGDAPATTVSSTTVSSTTASSTTASWTPTESSSRLADDAAFASPLRVFAPEGHAAPASLASRVALGANDAEMTLSPGVASFERTDDAAEGCTSAATFVLPVPSRVVRVVLRAGPEGVAAVGPRGTPPRIVLSVGDDARAAANAAPTASWSLARRDAGEKPDGSGAETDAGAEVRRRALRAGESVALALPAPASCPRARVVRLEIVGAVGTDASRFALDAASAKFVVVPSFPSVVESKSKSKTATAREDRSETSDGGSPSPAEKDATRRVTPSERGEDEDEDEDENDDAADDEDASSLATDPDPTRGCVIDAKTRRDVVAAFEASPPAPTRRVHPAFEETSAGGAVLHFGPPRDAIGDGAGGNGGGNGVVCGFRIVPPDPSPGAPPWIVRVVALVDGAANDAPGKANAEGKLGAGVSNGSGIASRASAGMTFEPPPLPRQTPARVGEFLVPVVRGRAPLAFDFDGEVRARRIIFESVVEGDEGAGVGAWRTPPPSLSGRIQCYRR